MATKDLQKYNTSVAFASLFALVSIGTLSYEVLEGWSLIESLYFSVVTLATVGYGDLHPTNDVSRLFTAIYILVGVSLAVSSFTVISTDRMNQAAERFKKMNRVMRERDEIPLD